MGERLGLESNCRDLKFLAIEPIPKLPKLLSFCLVIQMIGIAEA